MLQQVNPVDLAFAVFAAFFGAGLAFSLDEKSTRPTASRLYSQFTAVVLSGILSIIGLVKLEINVGYVAIMSMMVGLGGEMALTAVYQYLKEAKSLPDFIGRLMRAYRMVQGKEDQTNSDNQTTPKPDSMP